MQPSWRGKVAVQAARTVSARSRAHVGREELARSSSKEDDDEAVSRTFSRSDAEAARP